MILTNDSQELYDSDIIDGIAKLTGVKKLDIKDILKCFKIILRENLKEGKSVKISSIGEFSLDKKEYRIKLSGSKVK